MTKKALIIVDLQNDFLPGGALAAQEGEPLLPLINALLHHPFDLIVASQDWHPHDHGSFASQYGKTPGEEIELAGLPQILWPDHCIQNTPGAAFVRGLHVHKFHKIFHKGTDKKIDSYSTFYDNGHRKSTGLGEYLKEKGIDDVYLAGLTTEYCVRNSALDALKMGFNVYVVQDACRPVNLYPEDETVAIQEMHAAGVHLIDSTSLLRNAGGP